MGSSSNRPGKSKDESSQDDVLMAEQLLTELDKDESLNQRTRCMLSYTWFDVYVAKGDIDQAREYIEKASEIATRQNLEHEKESIKVRLDLLNKETSNHFISTIPLYASTCTLILSLIIAVLYFVT